MECFQLEERRTGEICNACVLLVKRWKKLPAGSNRNWRHVCLNKYSIIYFYYLIKHNYLQNTSYFYIL